MSSLLFDLRHALRVLGRNRGFAAMSILTLALGIGANSAIFAVVHGVLFRDLPFPQPDEVVAVTRTTSDNPRDNHAAADFVDLQRASRSFAALAAYRQDILDLSTPGVDPERLSGAQVGSAFFDVFLVKPILGRTFTEASDNPRGERLVVLGHAIWERRFAGDPAVVGRTIRINREPCTVVGVMPATFRFPGDAQAWVMAQGPVPTPPLAVEGDLLANREVHYFEAVGRLKAATGIAMARAELGGIAEELARRHPQTNRGQGLEAFPLRDVLTGDARGGLLVLLGAVGFVLLVACANVAGLALARASGRAQELGMRSALGASRPRLVRQFLIESLLVGLAGGAAGLLLASWGLDLLLTLVPETLPRVYEVRLDVTVTLFTFALGLLTALLFGVLPALQASRTEITAALRSGELRAGQRRSSRTMSALVVVEVGLGVVLTAGAGLMVNSLMRLKAVDPGYRTDQVVAVPLPLPATRYGTSAQQAEFYTSVLDRLADNPVTRMSAAAFPLPLSTASAAGGVQVEGRPAVTDRERPVASITWVSPGYFKVLGIPVRRGRDLAPTDVPTSPPVAVVSESAARRLWPDEDPLGKRFNFGSSDPAWVTVVGVAGDVRHQALSAAPGPMLYFPVRQNALPLMSLLVRSEAGAAAVAPAVRAVVRQMDPDLPVGDVTDLSARVARSIGEPRLRATLLSGFALAALLLAALGVYGLLSWTVARRGREIGIRLALGASPMQVFGAVVGDGMRLAGLGVAVGVVAAVGLSRLVSAQLYGVSASDPLTLAAVGLLLAGVALVACAIPARRVLRIDPVAALRAE